jgi:cell division transport system permease protein
MKQNVLRALQDLRDHRFLNLITMITIALSVLIVSAFALFYTNAAAMMNTWKKGVRVMVYLQPQLKPAVIAEKKRIVENMYGIEKVRFISSTEAIEILRSQLRRQSSLLDNLKDNPLPDAFEITMAPMSQSLEAISSLAQRLQSYVWVEEVEYGQVWLGRFNNIFQLLRLSGFALGGLFFMAVVFIVANIVRLVLYSRREEVEIMRLVGAADSFIAAPFYVQGLILGFFGGVIGLVSLLLLYLTISANVEPSSSLSASMLSIQFLPARRIAEILLTSMFGGWLGCFLSLKQYLKQ